MIPEAMFHNKAPDTKDKVGVVYKNHVTKDVMDTSYDLWGSDCMTSPYMAAMT